MRDKVTTDDFRVWEYDGVFEIQRRRIFDKTTGCLWRKKTEKVTEWRCVDIYGNCIFDYGMFSHLHYALKMPTFGCLDFALIEIDKIIEGVKYHYYPKEK